MDESTPQQYLSSSQRKEGGASLEEIQAIAGIITALVSLITVAVTGSLFGRWLAVGDGPYEAAYASAYHSVLGLVAAVAAALAVVTWWCFRDNPKSGAA